jgi:Holliday junction resolvasome RuvABC endonuclease subunit
MDVFDPDKVRILGIDPGTSEMGVSILELDIQHRSLSVIMSTSLSVRNKDVGSDTWLNMHDPQLLRIEYLMGCITQILWNYHPHFIGCESPFMHSQPNAFEALVRVQTALYATIKNYDLSRSMVLVSPNEAKGAVGGILGRDANKANIRDCVLSLPIGWSQEIDKYSLPPDAIDSIAVAVHLAKRILNNGLWA